MVYLFYIYYYSISGQRQWATWLHKSINFIIDFFGMQGADIIQLAFVGIDK